MRFSVNFVGTKKSKLFKATDDNFQAEHHQQGGIRHEVRQLITPEMPASDGHAE